MLVTGGASFIGSHLVDELVKLNADVRVADDFSSGKMENLSNSEKDIEIHKGDLRHKEFADKTIKDTDIVFHLAAAHGGRAYISTHPADCALNMALDEIVFWRAKENNVNNVVFASSACVYPAPLQEKGKVIRLKEDEVDVFTHGKACADEEYGWAKLMGEMSLRAYNRQYGLKGACCRIFTAYGPRENETHAIIALIARNFIKQDPFVVWGSGEQSRNFTYVSDIVAGLIKAASKIDDASAVNIGQDKLWSINEVMENIFKINGTAPKEIYRDATKPVGVFNRVADLTKAKKSLGWEPKVGLEEGLKLTIDWYAKTHKAEEVKGQLEHLIWNR